MTGKNVGIVSYPQESRVPYLFLSDLLRVLEPITNSVVLIDSGIDKLNYRPEMVKIHDVGITPKVSGNTGPLWKLRLAMDIFRVQIRTSIEIIKNRNNIDVLIFYLAYPNNILLPMLVSKICGIRSIEVITHSRQRLSNLPLVNMIYSLQDTIIFLLIDYISPESRSIINQLGLYKYPDKVLTEGARFIDTDTFRLKKPIRERKNVIGYIGRISEEKGISNLLQAFNMVSAERTDIEFLVAGEVLFSGINTYGLNNLKVLEWIDHDLLPDYLNDLKILVLPSKGEGLPTIVIEAMACGTLVLSTPVGGVPDVIEDGITGYIMENNSPESIAKNILRILNEQNISSVSTNAADRIKNSYSYESAKERYTKIINLNK